MSRGSQDPGFLVGISLDGIGGLEKEGKSKMMNPFRTSPFSSAPPGGAPPPADASLPQVTLVGKDKCIAQPWAGQAFATPDHGFQTAPAAGDDTTPNNYIPLEDANAFCANVRVTLGGAEGPSLTPTKRQVCALPEKVQLTAVVTEEHVIWCVSVDVKNTLSGVAAAVLDVPRLPGLLLLEEEHSVGEVRYAPSVMEREQADAAFEQAAASESHSASLGAIEDSSFSVKLDKVPPGAIATFGVKLLQSGGLKSFGAVVKDGDAPACALADLAVLPSFAPLLGRGVPFTFKLLYDEAFEVVLPPADVISHEAHTASRRHGGGGGGGGGGLFGSGGGGGGGKVDVASLVYLQPELSEVASPGKRTLAWAHATGPARGTLLRVRLSRRTDDTALTAGLAALGLAPAAPSVLEAVDTFSGVYFSPNDGAKHDASLVKLRVPPTLCLLHLRCSLH